MANMREVNRAIKAAFPALQIEAVRGDCYIYFIGDDGFDKIRSIYTHPVSTTTGTVVRMCLERITVELKEQEENDQEKSGSSVSVLGGDCVLCDPCVSPDLDIVESDASFVAVESAPLKAGDRIVSVVGGCRIAYVIEADAMDGVPTPARMEAWASDVGLSWDLCIVDEAGQDHEGMRRALEKVVEAYKKVGGHVPEILLVSPGHRGSSKSSALAEYQKQMFDRAIIEVSELRNLGHGLSRGQKRWNRKAMGYRNGH